MSQTLLDALPCVALLLRPQARKIIVSNAAAVKIGALPGTHCFSTWGQCQDPCPWCLAPALWATGKAQHLEVEALGIFWNAHWVPVAEDLYMHFAFDITNRKRAEERLNRINTSLLNLSYDYDRNIQSLTALCGELLHAGCALYSRLDGPLLSVRGQWNAPPGMKIEDTPEGHICFDVIRKTSESPLIIPRLQETEYVKTDPNVHAYGLQTYIGQTVRFSGVASGSLCVVYNWAYEPTDDDVQTLGIIASAIGQEEERRRAEGPP